MLRFIRILDVMLTLIVILCVSLAGGIGFGVLAIFLTGIK
jgi:hypothetical protein